MPINKITPKLHKIQAFYTIQDAFALRSVINALSTSLLTKTENAQNSGSILKSKPFLHTKNNFWSTSNLTQKSMITVRLQGQKKLPQSDFFLFANVFSFARHLAGFILVGKVFGTLGGSLRIRWKERVWVVKQDFHASFQGNVTFFCCCFFFCHFLSTPWLNRAHYRQPSHNFGFQSSVQKNKHQGREDTRSVTKRQCSHDLFHMIFPCTNMFCTLSTHPFLGRCKLKPRQNRNLKKAIIESSRNITWPVFSYKRFEYEQTL